MPYWEVELRTTTIVKADNEKQARRAAFDDFKEDLDICLADCIPREITEEEARESAWYLFEGEEGEDNDNPKDR